MVYSYFNLPSTLNYKQKAGELGPFSILENFCSVNCCFPSGVSSKLLQLCSCFSQQLIDSFTLVPANYYRSETKPGTHRSSDKQLPDFITEIWESVVENGQRPRLVEVTTRCKAKANISSSSNSNNGSSNSSSNRLHGIGFIHEVV